MTFTHAVSPLPAIIKGYHDKKLLKGVSKEWILLSLNNNACMGPYALLRGLTDSIIGNVIGKFYSLSKYRVFFKFSDNGSS